MAAASAIALSLIEDMTSHNVFSNAILFLISSGSKDLSVSSTFSIAALKSTRKLCCVMPALHDARAYFIEMCMGRSYKTARRKERGMAQWRTCFMLNFYTQNCRHYQVPQKSPNSLALHC
jgi:hypothetical protein